MRSPAYDQFKQYTSDMKLPIVEALQARKAEVWDLVKNQRDPQQIARWQGVMNELDAQIHYLLDK